MYKGYDSRRERPREGTSQASPSVLRKPMRSSHLNRRPPLRFGGQADGPSSCRLRWMSACARVVGEWRGRLQDAGGTGLEEGRQKRRDRRKRICDMRTWTHTVWVLPHLLRGIDVRGAVRVRRIRRQHGQHGQELAGSQDRRSDDVACWGDARWTRLYAPGAIARQHPRTRTGPRQVGARVTASVATSISLRVANIPGC